LVALSASLIGLCFFIIRLTLIFQDASLISFCIIYILELICVGLTICMIYLGRQNISIQFDFSVIKRHLKISWPLVLSGMAVTTYLKIDQVMLQQLAGSSVLGIYAAAIKLSEGWYFIGGIITTVMAPKVYRLQQSDQTGYDNFLKKMIAYLIVLAGMIVMLISILSDVLLNFLYGGSYQGASTILNVHIWALFFAYLGCVQGIYWIAEGLQKVFLYQNLCSALLNMSLNLLLIPAYQGVGAAWATVIAYGLPVLMVPYVVRRASHLHQIHLGAIYMIPSILRLKNNQNGNGLN
jgi:O-antigen/teichoic acid export membrane protein